MGMACTSQPPALGWCGMVESGPRRRFNLGIKFSQRHHWRTRCAVMSYRENLRFETEIESDTQSLESLVATMVDAVPEIRCMRDPTRGGLAALLNEVAQQAGLESM